MNRPSNISSTSHALQSTDKESRGVLVQDPQFAKYVQRHGLCRTCGRIRTHQRTSLFGKPGKPLTIKNETGEYVVYKGICLQPTCHTLAEAKDILGEVSPRTNKPAHKSHQRRTSESHGNLAHSQKRGKQHLVDTPTNTALDIPRLTATPSELLVQQLRRGTSRSSWAEAEKSLIELRGQIETLEPTFTIKLLCALLHQANPNRKRGDCRVPPSLAYCTQLVWTTVAVLCLHSVTRTKFLTSTRGPAAVLALSKKAYRRSRDLRKKELPFTELLNACLVVWNISTSHQPERRDLFTVLPELVAFLAEKIKHDCSPDAVCAFHHISCWYDRVPDSGESAISEAISKLKDDLWQILVNCENTDEGLIFSTGSLLREGFRRDPTAMPSFSKEHKNILFWRLSKHTSVGIHQIILDILQFVRWQPIEQAEAENGSNISCLCDILELHGTDKSIIGDGLSLLETVLEEAQVERLPTDLVTRLVKLALGKAKQLDGTEIKWRVARIVLHCLEGTAANLTGYFLSHADMISDCFEILALLPPQFLPRHCFSSEFLGFVVASLSSDVLNVRLPSVRLLARLSVSDRSLSTRLCQNPCFFSILIDSINVNESHPEVLRDICLVLCCSIEASSLLELSVMANKGGIDVILLLIDSCDEAEAIIIPATRAFVRLFPVATDKLFFTRHRVVTVLTRALGDPAGESEDASLVLLDACYHLCRTRDFFKDEFLKYTSVFLGCMERYVACFSVQKIACQMLTLLCDFDVHATARDTMSVLVSSMLEHCQHASFVREGVDIVVLLCYVEFPGVVEKFEKELAFLARFHRRDNDITAKIQSVLHPSAPLTNGNHSIP